MEFPWVTIVISVLVVIGALVVVVLCARWGGLGACVRRRFTRNRKPSKPDLPKSIQHALTQLEGVTEKRPARNSLTEAEEADCPICLAHLYASDTRTSTSIAADGEIDLEAGKAMWRQTTTIADTPDAAAKEKRQPSIQPVGDDVLKMKRCRHLFHARCLATWFLRKKYECPVCREPYYQVVDDSESDADYRIPPALPVLPVW